ncbi:Hemicentin-1, partial [Stegodyphus mimosarum]
SGIVGKTAVLPCKVESIVDYNVTWTKLAADEKNIGYVKAVPLPDVPRFLIYSNNSLVIKNLLSADEGWYRCKAANDGGAVQENIYLHAYEPPIVNVKPPSKSFVSGDFVNISCQTDGYPEPLIRWIWSPAHNQNFISGRSEIRDKN